MLAYNSPLGCMQLAPDVVRMKNRYEMSNKQGYLPQYKIEAKAQSYCCFIGATEDNIKYC
jgi:hypothetical protein